MRIVQGKRLIESPADLLARQLAEVTGVIVDVGTGDARTAYRAARAHPDWLVIGLDPAWQRMSATSTRALRKPAKGGTANLLLVAGVVETPPPELRGLADEVWVLMPWGKLLHGLVRGDPDVCGGLRALAADGATLTVAVGTGIWRDPVPLEIRGLPELTVDYVRTTLAPILADRGWHLSTVEVDRATGSSWAKRLGVAGGEPAIRLTATALPHPPPHPPPHQPILD